LLNPDNIWIAVDGGGTKTAFCACNSAGIKIYDKTFGNANYKVSDLGAVTENLIKAYNTMLSDLQILPEQIAGMVMGIAGCDSQQDVDIYLNIMRQAGIPKDKLYICNDTELIFRAISDEDGICAVAGTGSIVGGFNENAMVARMGGWGSPLSDEGSGYWVGAKILRGMIRWLDGMDEPYNPIYDEIRKRFISVEPELQWVLSALSITEVASVAPLVFAYATEGDDNCREIIRQAAEHLVGLIVNLCTKIKYAGRFTVVLVGGLFSNEEFYKTVKAGVRQLLPDSDIAFRRPENSPAEDGLLFARKRYPENTN